MYTLKYILCYITVDFITYYESVGKSKPLLDKSAVMFYGIWADILKAPQIQLDDLFQYLLKILNISPKRALYIILCMT